MSRLPVEPRWLAALARSARVRPPEKATAANPRFARGRLVAVLVAAAALLGAARRASAEQTLLKSEGGWEVFINGRVGGFATAVTGDGYPQTACDAAGGVRHTIAGGAGFNFRAERAIAIPNTACYTQGTIQGSRVSSGFVPNVFGFGLRRNITPWTTVTAYIAVWHAIETESRRKYRENFPDVREGYVRLDGLWGSLLVGRALTLFSRGATEIDFLYGHGFGVGNPSGYDTHGPSAGHVGFGVLANGFAAGIAYATPPIKGLQLTVGYYDPVTADGIAWERTKWGQTQGELTWDRRLGALGRLRLFANGGWQLLYKPNNDTDRANVYGVGYGGRIELGPARLGVAGHWGHGIGIFYAFDFGESVVERAQNTFKFRNFDGYYVQSQVKIRKFDLSAGWGITRMFLLQEDVFPDPVTMQPVNSLPMQQMGFSCGVFYHHTDYLIFGADYFLAQIKWWLDEQQTLNTFNVGTTLLF